MDVIERIESKIDRTAAGATEISMDLGGVKFQTMMELMEFAKMMSVSDLAVPAHLRGKPGACLAVCTKALRFGFDPFSLAERSYSMVKNTKDANGKWDSVETIAYDSYVIRAIINAHAPIDGNITYVFEGEGPDRVCIASAKRRDNGQIITHRSPKIGDILAGKKRNANNEIKGSPLWESPKVDVQLAYDTGRDLCRVHFPEILMGWYDKDEFDEQTARSVAAKDVTPRPALADRLKGNKGRGFSRDHVEKETAAAEIKTTPSTEPASPPASPVVGEDVAGESPTPVVSPTAQDTPATAPIEVADAFAMGRIARDSGHPGDVPEELTGDLFAAQREAFAAGYGG